MSEEITVVANTSYAVTLDDGRPLQPGEIADVEDSERIKAMIADGLLAVGPAKRTAAPAPKFRKYDWPNREIKTADRYWVSQSSEGVHADSESS